jgi:hypothetical protein
MLMDEMDCLCGIDHRYIYDLSWTAIDLEPCEFIMFKRRDQNTVETTTGTIVPDPPCE